MNVSHTKGNETSPGAKQTNCSVPAVKDLEIFGTKPNVIIIRWRLAWDEKSIEYVVWWEVMDGNCATSDCTPSGKATVERRYFAFDGLNPFTKICLTVTPHMTVGGEKCEGTPGSLCARSLPQDLSIRITALNRSAISIGWKKQEGADGYSVHYCTRRGPCTQLDFGAKNATCREVHFTEDTTELSVKKLRPWTSFLFKITPYSTSGIDCFTTRVGQPTEPRDINAKKLSKTTALVYWKPPADANGPLTRYHIKVTEDSPESRVIYDEDVNDASFVIHGIVWQIAYIIEVQAINYDYGYRVDVWGDPAAVRISSNP